MKSKQDIIFEEIEGRVLYLSGKGKYNPRENGFEQINFEINVIRFKHEATPISFSSFRNRFPYDCIKGIYVYNCDFRRFSVGAIYQDGHIYLVGQLTRNKGVK